jgi:hypothetical protein
MKAAFLAALAAMGGKYNVKRIAYQETRLGYHKVEWYEIYRYNKTIGMTVTLLNPTFLGAVYATTIVPTPIRLPPVATPPSIPVPISSSSDASSSNSTRKLTVIAGYSGS